MSEYTTYTIKDNMLVKDTTVRKYFKRGDYVDSSTSEPIVEVKHGNNG